MQNRQHQFPCDLTGQGGGGAALIKVRRKLVNVSCDHISLGHRQDGIQQSWKADAACLGSAGAREEAGIEAVKIDGEIDGHLAGN